MDGLSYELFSGNENLDAVFGVRRKVFVEEQNIAEEIEIDGLDGEALHVAVRDGGRVIGTARVRFPEPGTAKIERMAVLCEYRRSGVGRGIISFLEEELKKKRTGEIVLHAQWEAVGFYRSCGFRETGSPFTEAGIRHIEMRKSV